MSSIVHLLFSVSGECSEAIHSTPNPGVFDGSRNHRLRYANGDLEGREEDRGAAKREEYQFSSPEPTALSFGNGKTACSGRYLASLVVKMVFMNMLSEYGETRPKNMLAHEFLFCWPWQCMETKRRKNGVCPF
jgi:hypothetical protein